MNLTLRLAIYGTVIGLFILWGLIEGWYDIWPLGAIWLGACILIAEAGTQYSIWKRNR